MQGDASLPVVADWFEIERLDQDLVRVGEPHVSELVSANIWWLRGHSHDLVVDTGLGIASLRAHLPEMFDRDPLAVITHTHLDHVGGAHEFGRLAVHEAEAKAIASPTAASLDPDTELEILGLQVTPDTSLAPSLLRALPDPDFDPRTYAVRPAAATRVLRDGDMIDLGEAVLEVLHLPGHSPGSICLWDARRARLFTGDVIYDDELLDDMHGTDIAAYVTSMRRLLDLPVKAVYPGHGRPFDGERLREIAAGYIDHRATVDHD